MHGKKPNLSTCTILQQKLKRIASLISLFLTRIKLLQSISKVPDIPMEKSASKSVAIAGSGDKREITANVYHRFSGKFPPDATDLWG